MDMIVEKYWHLQVQRHLHASPWLQESLEKPQFHWNDVSRWFPVIQARTISCTVVPCHISSDYGVQMMLYLHVPFSWSTRFPVGHTTFPGYFDIARNLRCFLSCLHTLHVASWLLALGTWGSQNAIKCHHIITRGEGANLVVQDSKSRKQRSQSEWRKMKKYIENLQ